MTVASDSSVAETTERLEAALREQGLIVVAVIDHAANAENARFDLRPTRLIITGNPNLGTPLIQESQTVAIDLPQKFLIWEDENGDVFVGYNDPQYLADRHNITGQDNVLETAANALANFAQKAATSPTTQGQTLHVAANGAGEACTTESPCGSIQTAIDQAAVGAHIEIGPGVYSENITIPTEKEGSASCRCRA